MMGKREREKRDLLSGQCAMLMILCVLFLAGGVAGCLFASLADGEGAGQLGRYLTDYLTLADRAGVARAFLPMLWEHVRYLLAVVLFSTTVFGVVGIPALFCARGFFYSFSVACFCRIFGLAGLFPALALFGLPALLWGPALFLAGFQGMGSAQRLLRRNTGEGRGERLLSRTCIFRFGLCAMLLLICSAAEYFVVPVILRVAARIVL